MYGLASRAMAYALTFPNPETGGLRAVTPTAEEDADTREVAITFLSYLHRLTGREHFTDGALAT